jgi:UDP-N-acetylglucosamine 1-carboxyvinyltransferase
LSKYVINGGKELHGEVSVSGFKNAALAVVTSAILVEGTCVIGNIPKISDVTVHLEILKRMGAGVRLIDDTTVEINCSRLRGCRAVFDDLTRKTRASTYLMGAVLGRFGAAHVSMSGGCDLGSRPIDQHIKGFEALGCNVEVKNGAIHITAENGLHPARINFDQRTVGGTINVMMAAVRIQGQTIIENANKEPHIVDVANFLNAMGANITGAGTDVIKIRGVRRLHGGIYSIIPDQIEAGTFMAAVAATGGDIVIRNVIPKHLECISTKFEEMGVEIEDLGDAVRVRRTKPLRRANVKTMPYPGFPTDMNSQTAVLMCLARGTSIMTESVFQDRFRYVDELRRMGAKANVDGQMAVFEGVETLTGAPVQACDLRAGAALIIAGLAAQGVTEIGNIEHIIRGYDDLVAKFNALGAGIALVEEEIEVRILQNA